MIISFRPHSYRFALVAATAITAIVACTTSLVAASKSQITGGKISGTKLYAVVKTGNSSREVQMVRAYSKNATEKPDQFIIGENGNVLVYESRGKATGGYENEKAAVSRYHVNGKFSVLLDEPFGLDSIRQYRSQKGRTAYVITMSDGGAGIPFLYVCSTSGKVWSQGAARVAGARNGKLIVKQYVRGEEAGYEDARPIATLYLDLDTLLTAKKNTKK